MYHYKIEFFSRWGGVTTRVGAVGALCVCVPVGFHCFSRDVSVKGEECNDEQLESCTEM